MTLTEIFILDAIIGFAMGIVGGLIGIHWMKR